MIVRLTQGSWRIGVAIVGMAIVFLIAAPRPVLSAEADAQGVLHAVASRAVALTERAQLHLVGHPGVEFTEEGQGYGTYPGSVTIRLKLAGAHVTGSYFARSTHGTISGRASGTVVGSRTQPLVHFVGGVSISRGTGTFAHASGTLQIRGSIRRSSYALSEETSGTIKL